MSDIGSPIREVTVEPLTTPVPEVLPLPAPAPVKLPEPVPA